MPGWIAYSLVSDVLLPFCAAGAGETNTYCKRETQFVAWCVLIPFAMCSISKRVCCPALKCQIQNVAGLPTTNGRAPLTHTTTLSMCYQLLATFFDRVLA